MIQLVNIPSYLFVKAGQSMLRTFKSFYRKVESEVLDLSWKVFEKTGNVDTYLLIKEIERASDQQSQMEDLELVIEEQDSPTH